VHFVEVVDHFALAGANTGHVDVPLAVDDAELGAALKVRGYLGTVDDVLAGQTGDVGTGSAHGFLFYNDGVGAVRGEMPGEVFACFAAADDDCVVLLWDGHWALREFSGSDFEGYFSPR
jgi:hypothetical protein